MGVSIKNMATFLMGAAAGVALAKYLSMSDEEKEKFIAGLKEKANKFKGDAENTWEKAADYFEELKTKGADAMKDYGKDAENIIKDIFNKDKTKPGTEQA